MKKIISIILALMMCLALFASLSSAASVEADEIPLTGMSVTASSNNGGLTAEKAIDGNINTWWHSQISPMAKAPHEITITLASPQQVYGFRYYPRPDSGAGICTQYEIHVSPNGSSFSKVAEGTWTYNKATKEVHFGKGIQAKAVKLVLVNGHGGYGSAAEVRLLNDKAKAPTSTPTVKPSTQNSFTKEDEVSIDGVYMEASSIAGIQTADLALDGKTATCWHTTISPKAEGPHTLTMTLPEKTTIYGYRYYPRPDKGAGICKQYELHVSTDGKTFSKVAEGTWAYSADVKDIYFSKGIEVKSVRLVIIDGHGGYGSAAEVRLLNEKAKAPAGTATVTPDAKPATTPTTSSNSKEDEISVAGVTVETSSVAGVQKGDLAIDGKTGTCWHTSISPFAAAPHHITMILPEKTTVYGYRYYPRPDKGAGICTKYEIHVSADGTNFNKVAEGAWGYTIDEKNVYFGKGIEAKAVKLVILEGHGGYGSAAEIRLLNDKAKAPEIAPTITPETQTSFTKEDEVSIDGVYMEASSINGIQTADLALDGKTATCWHTTVNPKAAGPHSITMTLPEKTTIYGYRYYPRPDKGAGICTEYEIHVSEDGKTFKKIAEGAWDYTIDTKDVYFGKGVDVLAVKLVIVTGHGGFGSAAEVRLLNDKVAGKASNVTGKTLGAADELPTLNWKFEVSSVTENYSVPWDIPLNVIDGKLNTYWHTTINPKAELPHILTITLPKTEAISGFRYFPRTAGGAGICTKYEIQVSTDGVNYTTAATGNWENDTFAKDAKFKENVAAKYVKFIMLEANGGYGHAAEVRILKKDPSKPDGAGVAQIDPTVLSDDETSVAGWTFDTSSTNTNNGKPQEVPERTIDGDLVSHWHSHINPKADAPHYITAIFPEPTYISGFRYYPRGTGEAGICKRYEIYVSSDGTNFEKISEGTWSYDKKMKESDFLVNVQAKAVKLVILDGQYGFGSAGEIRMIKPKSGYNNVAVSDFASGIENFKLKPVIFDSMIITTSIDGKTSNVKSFISDGERGSIWTSASKGVLEGKADIAPPIDINYAFGYAYTINGFEYTPRSAASWHGKGHLKTVEVYTSENGVDYTLHETVEINDDDIEAVKYVFLKNPVKTKYLKLRIVKCRGLMVAIADLRFLQSGVQNEQDNINDEETYILHIGSKDIKVKKGTEEKTITIDVAPYIYNGSTMIPLRGLLEEMGATIGWNGDNQQITVKSRIGDMLFRIESWNVYLNGNRVSSPVAPQITDSRTFIPLRFVSETMGYNVYWNGETQEIKISNK